MLQVDFGERSQGSLSEFLGSGKDGQLGLPGRIPPHPCSAPDLGPGKFSKLPASPSLLLRCHGSQNSRVTSRAGSFQRLTTQWGLGIS